MTPAAGALRLQVRYCFPDDQLPHLSPEAPAPSLLPPGTPLPRKDDLIYLSSASAWMVFQVVHEWLAPDQLDVQVWLEHVGGARVVNDSPSNRRH